MHYYFIYNHFSGKDIFRVRKYKNNYFSLWNNQIFVAYKDPVLSLALFCWTQPAQYHNQSKCHMSTFFKAVLNVTVAGSFLVQKK